MDFVSKQQAYEGLRKLVISAAAHSGDRDLENLARETQMEGDHSRMPERYQDFLDMLVSDPLTPQSALRAAADFLEEEYKGENPQTLDLIRTAKAAAERPEDQVAFWNDWIGILESL